MTQTEFGGIKRTLVLELQDGATSEDPLMQFLERRGWTEKLVEKTQASISRKMTIDLFGNVEELSGIEVSLQNDIDGFFQWRATQ